MSWLQNRPIRTKLVVMMVTVSTIALVLSTVVHVLYELQDQRSRLEHDLSAIAAILGMNSTAALAFHDRSAAEEILAALVAKPAIAGAEVFDSDGKLFARYLRRDLQRENLAQSDNAFLWGYLGHEQPITLDGEQIGRIRVYSDYSEVREALSNDARVFAAFLFVALGCVLALSLLFERLISVPVAELAGIATRVSNEGDYSIRARRAGRDELGVLVDGFNEMLEQIQQRDQELLARRDELEDKVAQRTAELQRLNKELTRSKERAEAAARSKAQFLANMSHEIRTPMNGVLGTLELLEESDLDDSEARLVSMARASAVALLDIINDILDISKIEVGRLELESLPLDVHALVEDVTVMLAPQAYSKGVELSGLVRNSVPLDLRGDATRLRQILINLTGNAIKFTERGEVAIEVDRLEDEPASQRCWLRLRVRDTGIGIAQEIQQGIFEAFSQGDGSMSRRFGGTGLGLAIARQLTEMMGGSIGLESEPGAGTTFELRIPFPMDPSGEAPEPELPSALAGVSMLIAAENASHRRILEERARGWRIRFASVVSGREVLRRLEMACREGEPFDLLCLDRLTDIDQRELLRRIDQLSELAELQIVRILPLGPSDAAGDAELSQVAARLTKPFRTAELRQALLKARGVREPRSSTDEAASEAAPLETRFDARILVAEDNPVNQAVARRMLQKFGCEVTVVGNGEQVVEKALAEPFDLILMDCQMPILDGFRATAILREQERKSADGRHTPIVACTAHALEGDRERCLEAGMDDYISKPVTREALALMLASWLETDPNRSESQTEG
ncbi:MAG: ATP-binding protein [Myxococcota bacterium]